MIAGGGGGAGGRKKKGELRFTPTWSNNRKNPLSKRSPAFLASGIGFVEGSFSMD